MAYDAEDTYVFVNVVVVVVVLLVIAIIVFDVVTKATNFSIAKYNRMNLTL